jgi:hypothetical protein
MRRESIPVATPDASLRNAYRQALVTNDPSLWENWDAR